MTNGSELGRFLRSRRAATSLADTGLVSRGARRVPGLRREEVAHLARVSADYYVRLEQGRETRPSNQVLEALAGVFGLDAGQRRLLYTLAGALWVPPLPEKPVTLDASVLQLMNSMPGSACFVLDPILDLVATNDVARGLFSPFEDSGAVRNLAAMVFLDAAGQTFFGDWKIASHNCVALLRALSASYAGSPRRERLISELDSGSRTFRRLWADHDVRLDLHGDEVVLHPAAGRLTLHADALELFSAPGHQLIVYRARPGSPDEQRLLDLTHRPAGPGRPMVPSQTTPSAPGPAGSFVGGSAC
ncbi:helix-turn-helix transcriptional regulator [Kineosporia rhizophila]|uniref:helix-turn-helix transcriptional regulator n=1 Tax=Kineosporia rhizophila TaxID=84633 RepID=UPI001E5B53AE|nr:helix-turn-helix transcriptional regulator [Kineosporia rhizophila]